MNILEAQTRVIEKPVYPHAIRNIEKYRAPVLMVAREMMKPSMTPHHHIL